MPAHIALVLLNENAGDQQPPGGLTQGSKNSLFTSVIQKVGGDPVSSLFRWSAAPDSNTFPQAIVKRGLNRIIVRLPSQSPPPDETTLGPAAIKVLREAQSIQKTMHDSYIAQDHLLLALIKDSSIQPVIKEAGLTEAALKTAIDQIRGNRRVDTKNAEQGFDALSKYAVDLTALAADGKIDPVIGRDHEIRRVIRILCRRTKNNPVLIGEPGVGKTAVVEVCNVSVFLSSHSVAN